ncbi:unnamed protein product [Choristocarpus tenellus]
MQFAPKLDKMNIWDTRKRYTNISCLFSGIALGGMLLGAPPANVQPHINVALVSLQYCEDFSSKEAFAAYFLLAMAQFWCGSSVGNNYIKCKGLAIRCLTHLQESESGPTHEEKVTIHDIMKYRAMVDDILHPGDILSASVIPLPPVQGQIFGRDSKSRTILPRRKKPIPLRMVTDMLTHLGLSDWSPEKPPPIFGSDLRELCKLIQEEIRELDTQCSQTYEEHWGGMSEYLVGGAYVLVLACLKELDDMLPVVLKMVAALQRCPGLVLYNPHIMHIMLAVLKAHEKRTEYDKLWATRGCDGLPSFDQLIPGFLHCKTSICQGHIERILALGIDRKRHMGGGGFNMTFTLELPNPPCDDHTSVVPANFGHGASNCSGRLEMLAFGETESQRGAVTIGEASPCSQYAFREKTPVISRGDSTCLAVGDDTLGPNISQDPRGLVEELFRTETILTDSRGVGFEQQMQQKRGNQVAHRKWEKQAFGCVGEGIGEEEVKRLLREVNTSTGLCNGQWQDEGHDVDRAVACSNSKVPLDLSEQEEESSLEEGTGQSWTLRHVDCWKSKMQDFPHPPLAVCSKEAAGLLHVRGGCDEIIQEQSPLQLPVISDSLMDNIDRETEKLLLTSFVPPPLQYHHQLQQQDSICTIYPL